MAQDFSEMDTWSSEQVAEFKEEARAQSFSTMSRSLSREVSNGVGTIIAEGDSWFDYLPGTDVIDCLRRHYDYEIDNEGQAGDTLENMIYGTRVNGRFRRFPATIDQILSRIRALQPKIFLFSGGGNDIAGDEFESYLNHSEAGLTSDLRQPVVDLMFGTVFRKYLEDLIAKVKAESPQTNIVTHGYGYTVPTGEGVGIFGFNFSGPWLLPALAKKRIFEQDRQFEAVSTLITRYNELLAELDAQHDTFHHVDLRDIIDAQNDWANELHLKNSAFARVAEKIHERIQAISQSD